MLRLADTDGTVDASIVGNKAARLAELHRAGFPVPDGIVVAPGETFCAAEILDLLGGHVAVRSSALDEDTATASAAGMYLTVLDVDSADALVDAVARVRASGDSEQVRAYRTGSPTAVAVLIQRMIAATAAGVAFTADPITGRDEVHIGAVRGTAAALVDGTETGDAWIVADSDTATAIRTPVGALNRQQAAEIAILARQVEAHQGSPQDIEWAWDKSTLWILQARPMTALPDPRHTRR